MIFKLGLGLFLFPILEKYYITREVFYSQTNEEITKELKEQKILNFKEGKNYYCVFCNEMLFNKEKYDRHCTTFNHKINQSKLMNNSDCMKLLIF